MDLQIGSDRDGDVCVIDVRGEIDVYTSAALKQQIVDAVGGGCLHVIVDLQEVGFIDSSGLGVLVGGLRRTRERGGSLRLVCSREPILKTFRITGLDKVFPTFATLEEAKGF
jgi:anti-sigma B factor antagonist